MSKGTLGTAAAATVAAVIATISFGATSPASAQQSSSPVRLVTVSAHPAAGYLGVNFREASDEQTAAPAGAHRVEITQVDHDGPAGKAGVHEHDLLIQLNSQPVEGVDQLRRSLREISAGRTVTLTLVRDGQIQVVSTTLVNRETLERQAWDQHIPVQDPAQNAGSPVSPNPRSDRSQDPRGSGRLGFFAAGPTSGAAPLPHSMDRHLSGSAMLSPAYTGAALELLGPQLAEFFGAPDSNGLLVRSIEANSPAAAAGLRAGDVVLRVNQVAILAGADWMRLMHESKGRTVSVTVLREKKETTLTLTPDAKRRSALDMLAPATPEMLSFFAGRPVTR